MDREGDLSVTSIKEMLRGGENGPALVAGQAQRSKLIQVLTGDAEPAMPPEEEEQPNPDEIGVLRRWIDAGAKVTPTTRRRFWEHSSRLEFSQTATQSDRQADHVACLLPERRAVGGCTFSRGRIADRK